MAAKVIKAVGISKRINKSTRARLMKIQHKQLRNMLKSHFFVLEPQTMKSVQPFNLNLERVGMTQIFSDLLNATPIKWRVDCYILSREKNGKNKLQGDTIITDPCKHPEIGESLCDYHWDMVQDFKNSIQSDNFITAAWVASEVGTVVTEEQAYKIFENSGAWALETDYEEQQNELLNSGE